MPTAPAAPAARPVTCSIKGLVAFGPGLHKGELYTPARCTQIARNFAATGGRPVPLAKIGHDRQQRFARSLGFPNVGVVTRCEPIGDTGCFEVDIDNVPVEVGGKVNAGRLRGASVELKSKQRDPRDPARELPGDILTGISLLGEEQPCVANWPEGLRSRAVPVATFPDGSLVPADHEMSRWLDLAAEVSDDIAAEAGGQFSADRRTVRIKGRQYVADALCFSDFDTNPDATMTPEQEAALQAAGFTPEQIAAMKAAIPGNAPAVPPTSPTMSDGKPAAPATPGVSMADMCKKYADDPAATPEQKMMAAMYSDFSKKFADMESKSAEDKKRIGELQASAEAQQKATADAQMAAFSAEVDRVIEGEYTPAGVCVRPGLSRKVPPVARPALKKLLVDLYGPGVKAFSSEADRVKAFSDHVASLASTPDNPSLATGPGKAVVGTPSRLSATGLKVLTAIRDVNPRVYEKHAAATA